MEKPAQNYRLVVTTCPSMALAEQIAHALLERHCAACVNIIPGVRSIYRWHGKIEDDNEVILLVKTIESCLTQVQDCVRELHTYDVPEMIALPIVNGFTPYLNWITESVTPHD